MIWPRTGGLLYRNTGPRHAKYRGENGFFQSLPSAKPVKRVNKIKKKKNQLQIRNYFVFGTDMYREKPLFVTLTCRIVTNVLIPETLLRIECKFLSR